ncbi:hypothetical protein ACGLHS_28705 [Variovorax sp. VaC1]|uniref:hypothetical protein n=1 Tax=Variovorax sp. VaC1 TaxID=3373132 RepID=UPI003747DC07
MWYAAHAIFYFEMIDSAQDSYLLHENVYIVSAPSDVDARVMAERVARSNEDLSGDGHLEVNERKAKYVFAGIRKVVSAQMIPGPDDAPLSTGREITYSILEVNNIDEINSLVAGEMVDVLYRE